MLYQLKVTDIPMGKLRDKGTPIENISKYDGKTERILMLTSLEQIMGKKLIFATRMASVKVVPAEEFITNNRLTGIIPRLAIIWLAKPWINRNSTGLTTHP